MSVEEPEIGLFTLTRDADADAPGQGYGDLNDFGCVTYVQRRADDHS